VYSPKFVLFTVIYMYGYLNICLIEVGGCRFFCSLFFTTIA